MQFTTLLSATLISSIAFADEIVTTNGETITYVDITTTPQVTKSVVSTVLSTSTPHVTTTISKKASSKSSAAAKVTTSSAAKITSSAKITSAKITSAKVTTSAKAHSDLVQNVSQIGDGQIQAPKSLQISQQTNMITTDSTASTNLPQVDVFSAAGNNLNIENSMIGMVIAGLALL